MHADSANFLSAFIGGKGSFRSAPIQAIQCGMLWPEMEFRPKLDHSVEVPLYRQLYEQIGQQIRSGQLPRGERLPATRELAGQLGLNRTTVSAAYELLETEGLISGQVGRGSFVADLPEANRGL